MPETFGHCQSRPELQAVWACSDFISHTCISNPALLFDLIETGDLDKRYSSESYRIKIDNRIGICADEETLHRNLRQVRQREMVRIAWRDLAGFSTWKKPCVTCPFSQSRHSAWPWNTIHAGCPPGLASHSGVMVSLPRWSCWGWGNWAVAS